jgi:hypothetical protein
MAITLTAEMIDDLAAGSTFLGTGGGGDPYVGALLCKAAITRHGPVTVADIGDFAPGAQVICVAAVGAPTVLIEKLFSVEDADLAVRRLEVLFDFRADAVIAAEIGGMNATLPIAFAAQRGLPVVDGDGIGRAFPNLQMTTFNIAGVNAAPMVLASEHGESVLIEARSARRCEEIARPLVAAMGASLAMAGYRMSAEIARRAIAPRTLSAALAIGAAINDTRSATAPVDRLLAALEAQEAYGHAGVVFAGKIIDVERHTRDGWVFGHCDVAGLRGEDCVRVEFQNENLIARRGEQVLAIVPDLITIVDTESGRAIPTESLRYGQRVCLIACAAPAALRTEAALKVVGPQEFRLTEAWRPVETLSQAWTRPPAAKAA